MCETEKCDYENIKDYKTAFDCFKQRFLIGKKSIFNLNSDNEVLTSDGIKYLEDNFINNGYTGNASFIDKIKHQLITNPLKAIETDSDTLKNAIEILATAVWLWRLPPSNTNKQGRINSVKEILDLDENFKDLKNDDNLFLNEKVKGFATTGTYYNTNKPTELAYAIRFFKECLNQNKINSEILKPEDLNGKMSIKTKKDYSINKKGENILGNMPDNSHDEKRTVSIHNALLHFLDADNFEPIISNAHKNSIVKNLTQYCKIDEDDIDKKLNNIKKNMVKENEGFNENNFSFYQPEVREMWNPSILPAKNVIYYGAPGTGKTYELKKLVEAKIKAQCDVGDNPNDYYEIVQFHPSYSYEDFIDGIKPTGISENGTLKLELKNGIFKELCIKAFQELKKFNSLPKDKQKKKEPKQFYFIADEINRAELSRVFGELLLCLEEDKRIGFDSDGNLTESNLIKTQNYSLWKESHAVVKLDVAENKGFRFGVPENIYFLATMNDIDKSIDSFDLALRRRFKWVQKKCDYDVIYNHLFEKNVNDDSLSEYVSDEKSKTGRCNKLNDYISNKLNLGESYEIGHSYFMNVKVHGGKISKSACDNLFNLELAPLISEYLRAEIQEPKELKKELKKMKDIFTGDS